MYIKRAFCTAYKYARSRISISSYATCFLESSWADNFDVICSTLVTFNCTEQNIIIILQHSLFFCSVLLDKKQLCVYSYFNIIKSYLHYTFAYSNKSSTYIHFIKLDGILYFYLK